MESYGSENPAYSSLDWQKSAESQGSNNQTKSLQTIPFKTDPELYLLRRSERTRYTPRMYLNDSDDEEHNPKRKKVKRLNKGSKKNYTYDSEESEFSQESIDWNPSKTTSEKGDHLASDELRFSSRIRSVKDYRELDGNESTSSKEEENTINEQPNGIEVVLDYRAIENLENARASGCDLDGENPKHGYEYLVKWSGFSHLHNTWENYMFLNNYRGFKKVDNYYKNVILIDWEYKRDPNTTREDIEILEIEKEKMREALEEYKMIERVIATREIEGAQEFLVKWRQLPYDSCTWESKSTVQEIRYNAIEERNYRMRSNILPQKSIYYGISQRTFLKLESQPSYITGGELRDFQLTGVNWMAYLWSKNQNGILADEMGLGKTVQTVCFLSYLIHSLRQHGPFLVVVPLSTIPSWQETFEIWSNDINVVSYLGNNQAREVIKTFELGSLKDPIFNVLLTTYEYVLKDRAFLANFKWQYMAVDEAHRLKNKASSLYEALSNFKCKNRLLITGTPLQNNIRELAALVDFLMPGAFHNLGEINFESPNEEQEKYIRDLQSKLQPFILRRLKKDVEKSLPSKSERILRVELSDLQTYWYKNILTKNLSVLRAGVSSGQISLLNIMMELKKASNHPYLFDGAEESWLQNLDDYAQREDILRGIIMNSGKMVLLDKLLQRLKKDKHRVLIFSQMVRMLDILADYLTIRGYSFQRLDGTVPAATRRIAINQFNASDSTDFVFLLSTRAGGLGINLMTADTVILFDSDWNPQVDLQAMARAHRIGQKNHVLVYRLVSKDTVEEDILERARRKMILEYAIISLGITNKAKSTNPDKLSSQELSNIMKFGAKNMFKATDNQKKLEDLNLDEILEHAEDHDTNADLGGTSMGGEDFLKQFEVTDYKATPDWDDIIPLSERRKIEEQDGLQRESQYLLDQISRTERKEIGSETTKKRENLSRTQRRKKSLASSNLSDKDMRMLYKAILRYGHTRDRMQEIRREADLIGIDSEKLINATEELLNFCRNAIKDSREKTGEKSSQRLSKKALLVEYKSVKNINAETLIERVSGLEQLHEYIKNKISPDYRVPVPVRAVHGWSVPWDLECDSMLLLGIEKYGFGAWNLIRDDPMLDLSDKIFLEDSRVVQADKSSISLEPKSLQRTRSRSSTVNNDLDSQRNEENDSKLIPGAVHLSRRGDYLLSLLPQMIQVKSKKEDRRKAPAAKKTATKRANSTSPLTLGDITKENCKELLGPVKYDLNRLRNESKNKEKSQLVKLLSDCLLAIGDHIHKISLQYPESDRERLRKHLWTYTTRFWPKEKVSFDKLENMYFRIKL